MKRHILPGILVAKAKFAPVYLWLALLAPSVSARLVQTAEVRIDGGPAQTMTLANSSSAAQYWEGDFELQVPTTNLSVGPHWLELRMQGDNGVWCDWQGQWFRVDGETQLAAAEWFVDADPGAGKGTAISAPADGQWDEAEEDLLVANVSPDALGLGRHQLFLRAKDSNGDWGIVTAVMFFVDASMRLVAAEWTTDPNAQPGTGRSIKAVDGKFDAAQEDLVAVATSDELGPLCSVDSVYVRVQDNWGRWSHRHGFVWDEAGATWRFNPYLGWTGAWVRDLQVVPEAASLPSPADLTQAAGLTVSALAWNNCVGADKYDVFFSQQGKPRQLLAQALAGASYANPIPLLPGRAAFWFVRSVSNAGCSVDSPVWVILVPGPGDEDGDGMNDNWERQYFSFPGVADPRTDFDGDGFPDWEEYFALTDPTDPSSYFKVDHLEIRTNPFQTVVYWATAAGRLYTVSASTNLVSWRDLYQTTGAGTLQSFTNKFPNTVQQHYRVAVEIP